MILLYAIDLSLMCFSVDNTTTGNVLKTLYGQYFVSTKSHVSHPIQQQVSLQIDRIFDIIWSLSMWQIRPLEEQERYTIIKP